MPDGVLQEYSPDQPRDWHGRWTNGGSGGPPPTDQNRLAAPDSGILAQVEGPRGVVEQAGRKVEVPFMSDTDYNGVIRTAQKTNPATPGNNNVTTRAVIVEKAGGILGIGHTGIAISTPGAGFSPARMEYYDFGPLGSKTGAMRRKPLTLKVKGDRWWDNNARGYNAAAGKATGAKIADAKLSDILRDLPSLCGGTDVYMVVTQVTAAQAANIEAYWKNTMYTNPMPKYSFANLPTALNCTSSTYNSLLAAEKGNAGSVLGLTAIRKFASFTKTQAANPSKFWKFLLGDSWPLYKGTGLRRTAGDTAKPVDCYEWTSSNVQNKKQRWVLRPPN